MSSSLSPLLERSPVDKDGICNKVRNFSLWCLPLSLAAILTVCVIALVHPFWDSSQTLIPSTSSHPFMEVEHETASVLHSQNKKFLANDALSDLIDTLPGLNTEVDLSYSQFSGYVDALEGRQIHYWYFEAQSNPDTAPLFFWTNGGPGCSGLAGLLTEHGPFWNDNEEDLVINEYSWNKEVNIVYFEQPYGVGFSVVDDGMEAISGDDAAVADFDAAVRSFITKFPIYADRDIYLSSESFGGHYMPLTALEIMNNNEAGYTPYVNLKGFMVGNPYTNGEENTVGAMEAFYGHGLMREDIYETWKEYCFGDTTAMSTTQCRYLYMIGYYEADNTDHYALDFDLCPDETEWNKHGKHAMFHSKLIARTLNALLAQFQTDGDWDSYAENTIRPLFSKTNRHKKRKGSIKLPSRKQIQRLQAKLMGTVDEQTPQKQQEQERRRLNIEWAYQAAPYYPCAADLMTIYLNEDTVQESLHVKPTEWSMCNDEVFENWPETDWDNKMQPYYAELAAKYPQLKILVFSGDDDSVCGLHGTQYWLDNMGDYGWSVDSDNEWVPWEHNQQLAGYSTTYLTQTGNVALYFHTVRTAGHMVPQTQPDRALGLLRRYLYEMESNDVEA